MRTEIFWIMTRGRLIGDSDVSEERITSIFHPEDRGDMCLGNRSRLDMLVKIKFLIPIRIKPRTFTIVDNTLVIKLSRFRI
jgi:hypothetical protein